MYSYCPKLQSHMTSIVPVAPCHCQTKNTIIITRTTRTPAFWGYPRRLMITHSIESYWIPSQKKTKSIFLILKQTLHATHLLKLLEKMCKYELDPTSIVEDTERTPFCPQTDRGTDGLGETNIPPFQLRWSRGYDEIWFSGYHRFGWHI